MVRIRRIVAISTLVCAIPAMASAWTLNTWVKSAGGVMQSPNVTGNQTSFNGSINRSYTTTLPLSVKVTPDSGFRISRLVKNGIIQSIGGSAFDVYSTTVAGPSNQSVQATFARISYTLSASAGSHGTVSPTSISPVYNGLQTPLKTFIFTPFSGYNVQSISVPGYVINTDYQLFNAATNALVTLPAAPNVRVKVSIANVSGSTTVTGTFGILGANAGPAQTVLTGETVTLDGSASTGASTYAWTQVSGPETVTINSANSSQATFTAPATLGYYVFKLTINGGSSATTTVQVSNNYAQAARNTCINCHNTQGVGPGVFDNWSASGHKKNGVMCYTCHFGTNTGGHPGTITSTTVDMRTFNFTGSSTNFCVTCHDPSIPADFAASPHVAPAGADSCSFCHNNVHNPSTSCTNCHTPGNPYGLPWPPTGFSFHTGFTGADCVNCHNLHNPSVVTGAPFPHFSTYSTAQYVTPNISCENCHNSAVDNSFNIYPANVEWAKSGHADPVSPAFIGPEPHTEANLEAYDFKTLGTPLPATPATTVKQDCVRCHTTTGYINYVTPLVDEVTDPDRLTSFSDIHAWGTTADRTREMVACKACHNPTPFSADFSRRFVGLKYTDASFSETFVVQAWYNYSSAATKKIIRSKVYNNTDGFELGDSNICITCHSGTAAGNLIKQTTNSSLTNCANQSALPSIVCRLSGGVTVTAGLNNAFWSNADFIDPHGMGAANILMPDNLRAGYEYRLASTTTPFHASNIGIGSTGPCVGCHMSAPNKHAFSPISTASNGVITAITSPLCATCHTSGPGVIFPNGAADLETRKEGYQAALTVIATQLAARGVYFNADKAPYFFTTANTALQSPATRVTNWNAPAPDGAGANLMGAAFNLRLHQSDSGWVHNPATTKRLLYDTIDYLDDGNPANDTVATTIQNITGVNQTVKDSATAYLIPRP